jgi:putative DNA primase/helicase
VWDRFSYLPFTKTFTRDDSLKGRLLTELAGILNWCLVGWQDYYENDLFLPDRLREEKATLKAEGNDFQVYLSSFFERNTAGQVTREEAYYVFTDWWKANHPGKTWIPSSKQFAVELRKLGVGEKKSGDRRYWTGVMPNVAFERAKKKEEWPINA